MKCLALLFMLLATGHAAADVRVFQWQELRDAKTGKKQFGFFIAPQSVAKALQSDAEGRVKDVVIPIAKDAWDYGVVLTGESKIYPKEQITLFEPSPCGSLPQIVSGSIEVDWRKNLVRITLKVMQDGKVVDFIGNGVYPINKASSRAT